MNKNQAINKVSIAQCKIEDILTDYDNQKIRVEAERVLDSLNHLLIEIEEG